MNTINYTVTIPDTDAAKEMVDEMAEKVTAAQQRSESNADRLKQREEAVKVAVKEKAPPVEAKSADEETNETDTKEKPKAKSKAKAKTDE